DCRTSQSLRTSLAAVERITSPLLNLTCLDLLNPASLRYSRTRLGGGENHSAVGVLVHLGSLSASMSRLCLAFRGLGDRNEWMVVPLALSTRYDSTKKPRILLESISGRNSLEIIASYFEFC